MFELILRIWLQTFLIFPGFQAFDCRLWYIVKYKNGWRLYWDIFWISWNKFVIYYSFIYSFIYSRGIFEKESKGFKQKSSFNLIAVT